MIGCTDGPGTRLQVTHSHRGKQFGGRIEIETEDHLRCADPVLVTVTRTKQIILNNAVRDLILLAVTGLLKGVILPLVVPIFCCGFLCKYFMHSQVVGPETLVKITRNCFLSNYGTRTGIACSPTHCQKPWNIL